LIDYHLLFNKKSRR